MFIIAFSKCRKNTCNKKKKSKYHMAAYYNSILFPYLYFLAWHIMMLLCIQQPLLPQKILPSFHKVINGAKNWFFFFYHTFLAKCAVSMLSCGIFFRQMSNISIRASVSGGATYIIKIKKVNIGMLNCKFRYNILSNLPGRNSAESIRSACAL